MAQLLTGRLTAPAHGAITMSTRTRPLDTAALFAAHHAAVYRTAYRITGRAEDAEDVLQTVFLQLVRRTDAAEIENPGGYLHRQAVNTALNVLRHRRSRPAVGLDDEDGGDGVRGGADAGDPTAAELRERLRAALARVSPRAAEMFVLRYIEGYTNRQIAERFATSESSIGVTLHRARAQLRGLLGRQVESDRS